MYPDHTTLKNHPFNLEGMKDKDFFFGCKECGFQLGNREVTGPFTCPQCHVGHLNIFYVTPDDVK